MVFVFFCITSDLSHVCLFSSRILLLFVLRGHGLLLSYTSCLHVSVLRGHHFLTSAQNPYSSAVHIELCCHFPFLDHAFYSESLLLICPLVMALTIYYNLCWVCWLSYLNKVYVQIAWRLAWSQILYAWSAISNFNLVWINSYAIIKTKITRDCCDIH